MSKPLTLNLHLPDGSPENYIVITSFNWTGECVKCSRSDINKIATRYNDVKSGVYFLFGYNELKMPQVYVGESEDIVTRIMQHIKDKDKLWFEEVVLVTSSNILTKGHIKNLEYQLIKLIKNSIVYSSMNGNAGTESSLPDYMYPEINTFLEYTIMIMPILGYQGLFVNQKVETSPIIQDDILVYQKANGFLVDDKQFRVLKGSKMSINEVKSCSDYIKFARKRLLETGVVNSETCVFEKDFDFGSPSRAGSVIHGGAVNGWVVWKNVLGKTLHEIERATYDKQ